MEKHLLVLENDLKLESHAVEYFMRTYEGKQTLMLGFRYKSQEEIFRAFSTATDVVVSTCFVNGSDNQLHDMAHMLSLLPNPIRIHIKYIGGGSTGDLEAYLNDQLDVKVLKKIRHHQIFSIDYEFDHDIRDFVCTLKKVWFEDLWHQLNWEAFVQEYTDNAKSRPTGDHVKVRGCNAFGEQFKNLPLGQIVEVLDMSIVDPNPVRGLWIWGNGEPIKLLNETHYREYELQPRPQMDLVTQILRDIKKGVLQFQNKQFTPTEDTAISTWIQWALDGTDGEDDFSPLDLGNIICDNIVVENVYAETLYEMKNSSKLPKRHNRQYIVDVVKKHLKLETV